MYMEIQVVLTLLFLLLSILCSIVWWWNEIIYVNRVRFRCSKFKLPPGYLGLPFVGEMFSFLWYFKIVGDPDQFIRSKISKYGQNVGVYRTFLFGSPSIIACTPAICKYVLHSTNFDSGFSESVFGANSIVILNGTRHHLIKSLISNFVNRPDSLIRIARHIQPSIVIALESWSQMSKFKAFPELKKVIFDYMRRYVVRCEFGLSTDALIKLFTGITKGIRSESWSLPGTTIYHAVQCRKKLMRILKDELDKRKLENQPALLRNDLMDELMQKKDKEGNSLSDEEVLDNVLLLLHLSHTALSQVMPWSFYFLAKFPHVLEKLRVENMSMNQKKNGEYITYEEVMELKYTLQVVEELIRMSNISIYTLRKTTQDIEYKGYVIPKNWNVMVWIRYVHTDIANFDDPLCFNPDRWNNHPKPGTFLSFGGGANMCAGNMVARLNLAIFIHHLSIRYKWELINPDIPIKYLIYPHPADDLEISMSKITAF